MKNIRPLNDRVLIEREKTETRTKSGLFIPEAAQEKATIGKVIATGPGRIDERGRRVELLVKKGDRVLFSRYAQDGFDRAESDTIIVREDEIFGVID